MTDPEITARIEEIKDLQDELSDLTAALAVVPAAHNVRRLRRDAQHAAAVAELMSDKLNELSPMSMRIAPRTH